MLLYWLGRSYERSGNPAHARSFYIADATRFPLTYFGEKAAERLRPEPDGIGDSPLNPAEFLSVIPAAPPSLSPDWTSPFPKMWFGGRNSARKDASSAISRSMLRLNANIAQRYAETHSPQFSARWRPERQLQRRTLRRRNGRHTRRLSRSPRRGVWRKFRMKPGERPSPSPMNPYPAKRGGAQSSWIPCWLPAWFARESRV